MTPPRNDIPSRLLLLEHKHGTLEAGLVELKGAVAAGYSSMLARQESTENLLQTLVDARKKDASRWKSIWRGLQSVVVVFYRGAMAAAFAGLILQNPALASKLEPILKWLP